MRLKHYILALLFLISIVSAEQFTIEESKSIDYKGINIELVNVGSSGSTAVLQVDNIKKPLSKNRAEAIGDITIELLEISEISIKIEITQNVECLINDDCNDQKPCTDNICSDLGECTYIKTQGCELNNECKAQGSLTAISNKLVYCSANFEWTERKDKDVQCENNHECLSNLCENNKCTKPKQSEGGNEKMAPIWLVIIFGGILLLKGIYFLYKPKEAKNLVREFSYIREKKLRTLGAIIAIVGIILIVWALT